MTRSVCRPMGLWRQRKEMSSEAHHWRWPSSCVVPLPPYHTPHHSHHTMGKSSNKRIASSSATASIWTAADHAERTLAQRRRKTALQEKRRSILSHETKEKRDDLKLKLHITRVSRELAALKSRLEAWDPVEEKKRKQEEEERQRQAAAEPATKKRRANVPRPETWKLKGAARPAWEVYDFDTRYVDPHIQAHERAKEKACRSVNVLAVHKGKLATEGPEPAREYLALLMQLGYLNDDARKYKSARAAWRECIELEGPNPITTARESLMRMYLKVKRMDDALALGESLPDDTSVWIRYSLALVAYGKNHTQAADYMRKAVQANPLCAYYLAFLDVFDSVMEHTDDLDDSDNEPESSLEEAIEYCTSGQEQVWQESGADVKLREILLNTIRGQDKSLSASDVDWSDRLLKIESELARRQQKLETEDNDGSDSAETMPVKTEEQSTERDGDDKQALKSDEASDDDEQDAVDTDDEQEEPVDVAMYIQMFRTAMEMVEADGHAVAMPK